jgi:hypothetical protein
MLLEKTRRASAGKRILPLGFALFVAGLALVVVGVWVLDYSPTWILTGTPLAILGVNVSIQCYKLVPYDLLKLGRVLLWWSWVMVIMFSLLLAVLIAKQTIGF